MLVVGTVDFFTFVVFFFTDVFVESHIGAVFSGSAVLFDTKSINAQAFTIGTIFASLCVGDAITGIMTLTFNVFAFAIIFVALLVDTKERVGWTVFVFGTLYSSAFVSLTSFVFTAGVVTNTVDFLTFVGLAITYVVFTVDIEWFAVCVGSAFDNRTFVIGTDFLFATECMSATLDFDTLWISVIGCTITDFRFLVVEWIRVTWITVGLFFTVYWLTSVGTFLDLVGTGIIGDDDTVRETFMWGIVTVAVVMGVTFLFNTFVIVTIVLVLSDLIISYLLSLPVYCIYFSHIFYREP